MRIVPVGIALSILLTACSGGASDGPDGKPSSTIEAPALGQSYLDAWSTGDLPAAAEQTTDPQAAERALSELNTELELTSVRATPGTLATAAPAADGTERAKLPFTAALDLQGLGEWNYEGSLPLLRTPSGWQVDWSPAAIHPQLTTDTKLTRARIDATQVTLLDRDGKPLMAPRPVVSVSIRPDRLVQPAAAYRVLDKLGRDVAKAKAQVAAAAPTATLPQITVRESDFRPYAAQAKAAGLVTLPGKRTLAPTRTFGQAVLGSILASEDVRTSGGGGEVRLVARDEAAPEAQDGVTLHRFVGEPPAPIRTSLDLEVQKAAESALSGLSGKAAALVAISTKTGEVLAAANRDTSGPATGFNRAFVGQYPPGSTFKIVTAGALIERGLKIDEEVACPKEIVVRGKKFDNAGEFVLGKVPFRTDFAQSCNTAFISRSKDLPNEALVEQAKKFGFSRDWDAGVPTFSGSVREFGDDVDKVAASIGQGTVLASPLAMAVVASTAASGTYVPPVVLSAAEQADDTAGSPGSAAASASASAPASTPATAPAAGDPLPPVVAEALPKLMRGVVTDGSGKAALGDLSGTIGAKTGTAEFASSKKPGTHAWMVGFRDGMAWAVLIENGGGGGRNAGPIARKFLQAAPR